MGAIMGIRLSGSLSGLISALSLVVPLSIGSASAQDRRQDCSAKYQAAKAAGSLGGQDLAAVFQPVHGRIEGRDTRAERKQASARHSGSPGTRCSGRGAGPCCHSATRGGRDHQPQPQPHDSHHAHDTHAAAHRSGAGSSRHSAAGGRQPLAAPHAHAKVAAVRDARGAAS